MLETINGYKDGFIGKNKWYIGRANKKLGLAASSLANPFIIGKHGTREEVIDKYYAWLKLCVEEKLDPIYTDFLTLVWEYLMTETSYLVCYCKPQACHGDVIIKLIQYFLMEWYLQ